MADAILQYRNKAVRLKPGHSAVLPCYKKEMLGRVIVKAEPNEDGSIVPDGTKLITENGEADIALYAKANVQVLPDEDVEITPTEEAQTVDFDPDKKGIRKVTVEPILIEEIEPITENVRVKASEGKYFKEVVVSVPAGATVSGTYDVDKNGTYNVTDFAYARVEVLPDEVLPVVPTEEDKTYYYDTTKKGIKQVDVSAIQAGGLDIDGSGVSFIPLERKFSGSFTPSAGSYYNKVDLSIPLPTDYIKPENVGRELKTNNTEYDVTKDKKVTVKLPMQVDKAITPSEAVQVVSCDVDGNNYQGMQSVKVAAIQIHTPEVVTTPTATVTAPQGKYIKQVQVSVPTVAVYSGTSKPDNSTGKDGDIYLVLEG